MHTYKIIFLLFTLILSGCTTVQSLTPEQRDRIRSIHVVSKLDSNVGYKKFGDTIFQNSVLQTIDTELVDDFVVYIKEHLETLGYTVVEQNTDADAILEMTPYAPRIPYTISLSGIGLLTHKTLLFNTGVKLQTNVCFHLKDKTGKTTFVSEWIGGTGTETGIKNSHKDWKSYSESTRSELIQMLKIQLQNEAKTAFERLGF